MRPGSSFRHLGKIIGAAAYGVSLPTHSPYADVIARLHIHPAYADLLCSLHSQYATMNPVKITYQEGESPLKAVRQALGGLSREKFAARIGAVSTTVKRWEEGGKIMLTLEQAKNLNRELRSLGMTIEDLPDNLGPTTESA